MITPATSPKILKTVKDLMNSDERNIFNWRDPIMTSLRAIFVKFPHLQEMHIVEIHHCGKDIALNRPKIKSESSIGLFEFKKIYPDVGLIKGEPKRILGGICISSKLKNGKFVGVLNFGHSKPITETAGDSRFVSTELYFGHDSLVIGHLFNQLSYKLEE